jgi:hypothetical protein
MGDIFGCQSSDVVKNKKKTALPIPNLNVSSPFLFHFFHSFYFDRKT